MRFPGDEDLERAERIQSQGIPLEPAVYEKLGASVSGGWKTAER